MSSKNNILLFDETVIAIAVRHKGLSGDFFHYNREILMLHNVVLFIVE
jgi:hypothetical protein